MATIAFYWLTYSAAATAGFVLAAVLAANRGGSPGDRQDRLARRPSPYSGSPRAVMAYRERDIDETGR